MDNQQQTVSGSPNSSEEVESHHGTPATKLSTFSPEDVRTRQKPGTYAVSHMNLPPSFALRPGAFKSCQKGGGHSSSVFSNSDPFTTTSTASFTTQSFLDAPKLSPYASTFTPIGPPASFAEGFGASTSALPSTTFRVDGASSTAGSTTTKLEQSTVTSQPELMKLLYSGTSTSQVSPTSQSSDSSFASTNTGFRRMEFGQFSSDVNLSRHLMISQVARNTSVEHFDTLFNPRDFASLRHVVLSDLLLTGRIYISFADLRDANKAYTMVQSVRHDWNVQHIAIGQVNIKGQLEGLTCSSGSPYEGQVVIRVDYSGHGLFNVGDIGSLVKELLGNYGEIMAYSTNHATPPVVSYRAEFYSAIAADNALAHLNGFKLADCVLTTMRYSPRTEGVSYRLPREHGPLIVGQENVSLDNAFGNMALNGRRQSYDSDALRAAFVAPYFLSNAASRSLSYRRDIAGQQLPSALDACRHSGDLTQSSGSSPQWSPVYSPYPDYTLHSPSWATYSPGAYSSSSYSPGMITPTGYSPGAIGQERVAPQTPQSRPSQFPQQHGGLSKIGNRQSHDFASGHHNVVDVDRIRQGTDVRTTIMLRNIPNKIDQAMLKDIVDETSRGKYDFMYLRIDFANNCNVGYAFINFEDPYFIIDFVNARAGHRWNRYNSDKVAEVSYATIQGRDCLVQKFRNSSVMLEHPSFRPKIFHTGSGPLAGTEDKFPGPDNPSKMRRSVENAEHVGLFAPRAGQNFRDEQRRRRSQYDRGTRLAEIEDAYFYDRQGYKTDPNQYYLGDQYNSRLRGPPHPGFEVY